MTDELWMSCDMWVMRLMMVRQKQIGAIKWDK